MNDTENKTNNAEQDEMQDVELHDTEQEYLKALYDVKIGYIWTVVITLALMAASVATALFYRVYLGLLILALAVIVYLAIAKNLTYSKLGISFRTLHGCLTVTNLYGKNRQTVYIPKKLMIFTVTEIGARAFTHESSKSIRNIYIPKSVIRIGSSAFARLHSLTDIYYEGSEEEWEILSRLAPLEDVTVHFGCDMPRLKTAKEKKAEKSEINNAEPSESNSDGKDYDN